MNATRTYPNNEIGRGATFDEPGKIDTLTNRCQRICGQTARIESMLQELSDRIILRVAPPGANPSAAPLASHSDECLTQSEQSLIRVEDMISSLLSRV